MDGKKLKNEIFSRYKPFLDEILASYGEKKIHSVHVTGSALTEDFLPQRSDINSVIVLGTMDLEFLRFIAPLGKKYGKKGLAAPLIMSPAYIAKSTDVFPIEFLNIKLLHQTVFGTDIFQDLEVRMADLRRQCEQELKAKLIGLRQGYIRAAGDKKILAQGFTDTFAGYIPLFKALIVLLGQQAPRHNRQVLAALQEASGVSTAVFKTVLTLKKEKTRLSLEQLNTIFEDYYRAIEKLGEITDALED